MVGMSAPIEQPTARRSGSPAAIWTALSLVYVAWSTTFVAIRVTNETIPPLLGGGIRFLIAGGVLLLFALLQIAAGLARQYDGGKRRGWC